MTGPQTVGRALFAAPFFGNSLPCVCVYSCVCRVYIYIYICTIYHLKGIEQVPYDDPSNGGRGKYFLGTDSKEGRGARPATVRVAEIGSLRT